MRKGKPGLNSKETLCGQNEDGWRDQEGGREHFGFQQSVDYSSLLNGNADKLLSLSETAKLLS